MDAHHERTAVSTPKHIPRQTTVLKHDLPTPSASPDSSFYAKPMTLIGSYIEMWDYVGGARFRGFVVDKDGERTMFAFFDQEVIGKDLKPGLMSLLELASSKSFECSKLVVCVDRTAPEDDVKDLGRDLGWVGFELTMLDEWAGEAGCLSDRWVFMVMDV